MYKFLDDFGLPVTLTFDKEIYKHNKAGHVLVFAYLGKKLLFTIHTIRGIELPGGKVEKNETSIAAAIRETYEETGFSLDYIEKIGQYTIGEHMIKDIFIARVENQETQIKEGTVGGYILFNQIPEKIKGNPKFSRYLYDEVYPLTLSYIRENSLIPIHEVNQK